ncbi:hypothetical protein BpHYR1_030809 [Brachionus plicatilis]|uniref:Uncharacterized protein n=1 Tax=Brachionus plicatilis TaxID=10195 RepID=A0A3M7PAG1_BRAPC|nr:hypothetical protein BpHYR1_030809 [Brachionus plicatilis]
MFPFDFKFKTGDYFIFHFKPTKIVNLLDAFFLGGSIKKAKQRIGQHLYSINYFRQNIRKILQILDPEEGHFWSKRADRFLKLKINLRENIQGRFNNQNSTNFSE